MTISPELGTTEQAAAICGVKPSTYRSYRGRFGAPDPVASEPGRGGQDLYDLAAVRAWHAGRRGPGYRSDLRPDDPATPLVPTPVVRMPAVVYLRGAGAGKTTWSRLTWAVAEQGWYAVDVHTTAWHLARSECMPVVQVDVTPVDGAGRSKTTVLVQRVRARYSPDHEMELVRAKGAGGLFDRPEVVDREVVDNVGQRGAVVLDVDAVVAMVRDVLAG